MKTVTAKLGTMRKPQEFVVYPPSDKGRVIFQSDKAIGAFDIKTGEGILNTKGCYFPHLNQALGAQPYTFPQDFVLQCIGAYMGTGSLIGTHPVTGAIYMGTVTEI